MNLQPACVWLRRWRELDTAKRLVSDQEEIIGLYESLAEVVGQDAIDEKYSEYLRGDGGPIVEGIALLRDAYQLCGLRDAVKQDLNAKRRKTNQSQSAVSLLPQDNLTRRNAEKVWANSGNSRKLVADAVELALAHGGVLNIEPEIGVVEIDAVTTEMLRFVETPEAASPKGPSWEQRAICELFIESPRCSKVDVKARVGYSLDASTDNATRAFINRINTKLIAGKFDCRLLMGKTETSLVSPKMFDQSRSKKVKGATEGK